MEDKRRTTVDELRKYKKKHEQLRKRVKSLENDLEDLRYELKKHREDSKHPYDWGADDWS